MPTSLISTGVQFPDNSIQTVALPAPGSNGNVLTSNGTTWTSTAPSGAGGATQAGSILFSDTQKNAFLAANPAAQIASPFFSTQPQPLFTGSGGTKQIAVGGAPKWSSYYGGWLAVGSVGQNPFTDDTYIYFSADGLSWTPFVQAFNRSGTNTILFSTLADGTAPVAVDETNGRIFLAFSDQSNYQAGVYYTNAPVFSSSLTWTRVNLLSGAAFPDIANMNSLEYVQMASTGTSRIVAVASLQSNSQLFIYTCPTGSVTFTQAASFSPPLARESTISWNSTFQRAMIVSWSWTSVAYSATNNLDSWTTSSGFANTVTTPTYNKSAMSGNRAAILTTAGIRYTSNFSTWTSAANTQYNFIWYNGSRWMAMLAATGGASSTTGLYTSTSTDPVSFTRVNGGFYAPSTGIGVRNY